MKQSYIIISDVHLGNSESNHKEFCHFLEWVRDLANGPKIIKCDNREVTIENPEKIILLGDILDLWNPKNGNRDNVIKDCIRPFSLLSNINSDKIFVVGNHDDTLGELEGKVDHETLDNGTRFAIYDRHYPKKDKKSGIASGLKIGKRSYFFLHGHQFDKQQAIMKHVSALWDPINWFQDLFNVTFTKKHWKVNFIIFLGLLLGEKYFLWNVFLQSSFWGNLGWAMVTGFFALSSIPGIVANTQGTIYNFTKPADKTAEQVIQHKYYQKNKETIDADVVVFGHTHFASSYELKTEAGKKLFLNSGCWIGTDTEFNGTICYVNTFIYLDEIGAYILTWRGSGKIECIEALTQ
jgi:UDP-2,3-diacylglucosamine pyrophosphatase LpxH